MGLRAIGYLESILKGLKLSGLEELGFGVGVESGLMTKVFGSLIEKVFGLALDYRMYVIEFICENSTLVE